MGDEVPFKELGDHIRKMRERRKISRRSLSTRMGFDPSYVSYLESGKRRMSPYNLDRLCQELTPTREDLVRLYDLMGLELTSPEITYHETDPDLRDMERLLCDPEVPKLVKDLARDTIRILLRSLERSKLESSESLSNKRNILYP